MNLKLLYLLFLSIIISGCTFKKKAIQNNILHKYRITIEDVECPLCAEDAVNKLKNIKNIKKAKFFDNDGDYESGYAYIEAIENINQSYIKECLQEEGFDLKNIIKES